MMIYVQRFLQRTGARASATAKFLRFDTQIHLVGVAPAGLGSLFTSSQHCNGSFSLLRSKRDAAVSHGILADMEAHRSCSG
jgi:hypothetical protein